MNCKEHKQHDKKRNDNTTSVIISCKAKINKKCPDLKKSIYGLYHCVNKDVIEKIKKLKKNDQIIINCCGEVKLGKKKHRKKN